MDIACIAVGFPQRTRSVWFRSAVIGQCARIAQSLVAQGFAQGRLLRLACAYCEVTPAFRFCPDRGNPV